MPRPYRCCLKDRKTYPAAREVEMKQLLVKNGFNSLDHLPIRSDRAKSSPRAYLDLGITTSHQTRTKPARKTRSEKLESRYKSQAKLVRLLNEVNQSDTAERMALCGQKYDVLTCGEHISAKKPYDRCNVRYCSLCASRRSARYKKKYLAYAKEFMRLSPVKLTPCLLTLTQKKIKGERLAKSRERILQSFRNFIRHNFFNEYFAGGVYAVENTVSNEGNHLHLHIVVFRTKFVDHKLLKAQWAMVSLGAKNLNIKLIDDLERGLGEAIKYISKPIDIHRFQTKHLLELLEIKGKRMIGAFGEFGKFCTKHTLPEVEKEEREKIAEGQCCSQCSEKLFHSVMSGDDLISFYRQVEQIERERGSPPAIKLKDSRYGLGYLAH